MASERKSVIKPMFNPRVHLRVTACEWHVLKQFVVQNLDRTAQEAG